MYIITYHVWLGLVPTKANYLTHNSTDVDLVEGSSLRYVVTTRINIDLLWKVKQL